VKESLSVSTAVMVPVTSPLLRLVKTPAAAAPVGLALAGLILTVTGTDTTPAVSVANRDGKGVGLVRRRRAHSRGRVGVPQRSAYMLIAPVEPTTMLPFAAVLAL